ncbi:hypothetical protein [Dyadobacter pollutisoli]|jgi:hypothetical protein|uniref:Collagen-like protein n=1 Tax=Dyadobacter pollutisoli TaxID=2910158 RepID=A0A9E8NA12_9BACT|nr:hypothetical protein [Dyadobacter pollutisoli]WAC12113.1 hypothetical protein ON006_30845 [Dyadobacter pollutisoli]
MFRRLLLFACVALMIALVSCEGKQGEVGPKGDTGTAGPAGPAGPAGADGEDGAGSSALIISSGKDTTDADGTYITGISDLTAEEDSLLSASAVLVYIKSGGVYWALPGIVSFGTGKLSSYTFVHGVQESTFFVQLLPTNWSEDQDDAPVRIFEDVRIVIIPGTIVGRMNAQVDFKNYEKTIAALGLTDKEVKMGKQLKRFLKK